MVRHMDAKHESLLDDMRVLGPAMGALAIFAVICGALGTTLGLGGGGA